MQETFGEQNKLLSVSFNDKILVNDEGTPCSATEFPLGKQLGQQLW